MLKKVAASHECVVTLEDNVLQGGFGQQVSSWLYEHELFPKMIHIAVPDQFIEHGSVEQLFKKLGMDAESVVEKIAELTL